MDLRLHNISHRYGDLEVLSDIDLDIKHGQIVCIIGPSGCGKSTLLRFIGGLEKPSAGEVLQIGETPASSLNPLTYIFQDFALLPCRTVEGNISLALEDHGMAKAQSAAIIDDVPATLVHVVDPYPGGDGYHLGHDLGSRAAYDVWRARAIGPRLEIHRFDP